MKKHLKKAITVLLFGILISGCAVTQKHIDDRQASPDSSTPTQYSSIYNGGILGYVLKDNRAVYIPITGRVGEIRAIIITQNKRAQWNNLIDKYKNRAQSELAVTLTKDSFILPYTDQFGNSVYVLQAEGAKYFKTLRSWQRSGYNK